MKLTVLLFAALFCSLPLIAEDGSRLWLRQANGAQAQVTAPHHSATLDIAMHELQEGWYGKPVVLVLKKGKKLKKEGFCIREEDNRIILTSPSETGLLYGAYHLLRQQETHACEVSMQNESSPPPVYACTENPAYDLRILNHWDNLDRTVERGYAGQSLWNWEELPATLSPRYEAYARANASIGINATVLNNVNAAPRILSTEYLEKVQALANVFRPYGIRVFLSVNFASPMILDNLPTADPQNKAVVSWWNKKVKEIYRLIPDFGGFLVKANSEGQPGPCDFGRTHAEGANMLARALAPHKGIVMWRTFVYSPSDADRAKQAYLEFMPLDGAFLPNVILQIKNGPVDFQPREPYSPLFTAMRNTSMMAEFQITQEYLGHSNHIAFLAPMWKEFFEFVSPSSLKAVAGVSNIGTDTNWCGHPFAQANWYAFGRLAWNPSLTSADIADEWLKQSIYTSKTQAKDEKPAYDTTTHDSLSFCLLHTSLIQMMEDSREAVVNYMMPLGLHHLFAWGHHYGPEPWCNIPDARPDWLPSYYHKADREGIGFNRSHTGSNATAQYPDSLQQLYDNPNTCPDNYLLWFHHVAWTHRLQNGNTLWKELCYRYDQGVQQVKNFQKIWDKAQPYVNLHRFKEVQSLMKIQVRDAVWWKDACLLYFQEFSGMPFPDTLERPIHELHELKQVNLPLTNYECPSGVLLNKMR